MIRLTVLGACGTYPSAGRACSGYLLEATSGGRSARVWVDTGSGTLANLLRYASLPELDAIWLSHLHVDHCSDLPVAYYALRYGGLDPPPPPLPVYGPSGWGEHIRAFTLQDSMGAIEEAFEVHELHDRERVRLGPLELTAMATVHSVETYGLRASVPGATLAYSADSGPCDALAELAHDADLFLCEAAWSQRPMVAAEPIHMTPALAGEWAARAGARRLVLTHLRPGGDTAAALHQARRAAAGLPVDLAAERGRFEVGEPGRSPEPVGTTEPGAASESGGPR
jgi:ribonuclease BN (tRNA processing enzyme)